MLYDRHVSLSDEACRERSGGRNFPMSSWANNQTESAFVKAYT